MKNKSIIIIITIIVLILVGCNNTKKVQFTDIVNNEIVKISSRYSGNCILYSTTNIDLVNKFVIAMKSDEYYESNYKDVEITGTSTIHLYDKNNIEIASITFEGKNIVRINNKLYISKANIQGILGEYFYKEFYTDKNIVKE